MLSDQVVDATVTSVVKNEDTVYLGMDGGQTIELANVRQVSTPKQVVEETKTADDTAKEEKKQTLTAGSAS